MTDLILANQNILPAKLEDLAKFVLIGRDKLQAVRAEINAISKLDIAREVREQKLHEAQEIGALVLLAEDKCGELFNSMPKISGGDRRSENFKIPSAGNFGNDDPSKSKLEIASELGFNKNQVSQFQKLADNPALVQKTIIDAKDNDEIPTRSAVLDELKKVQRTEKANERLERKQFELADEMPADVCKFFCADIRDGLPQIADNFIDFIITAPPYPKEYLPALYRFIKSCGAYPKRRRLSCLYGRTILFARCH